MFRRWTIRGLFISLIALCLIGWGWSVGHSGGLCYGSEGFVALTTYGGLVVLAGATPGYASYSGLWSTDESPERVFLDSHWLPWFGSAWDTEGLEWLGFCAHWAHDAPSSWYVNLTIPYWFLLLLFSLLLLYTWRKTRPKPNPATAFPVQTSSAKP